MDLAELLEQNKGEIQRRLADDLTKRVAESLNWSLSNAVSEYAQTYIKENVLPDVQKQLEAERDQITATIVAAVKTGVDALGHALAKKMADNVASGWKISQVTKALLD